MRKIAAAGAAFTVVVAGQARADDLAQLKAQLENLNAEIARLEPAPVLAMDGDGAMLLIDPAKGHPGSASIKWQGYVRTIAGLVGEHEGFDGDQGHSHHGKIYEIPLRAQLEVAAKTDTAVGEVGTSLKLRGDYAASAQSFDTLPANPRLKEAWGYWSISKSLTIGGGITKSLGNMDFGLDNDGSCTCYYTNKGTASDLRQSDAAQLRLTAVEGPLTGAVSVQSAIPEDKFNNAFSNTAGQLAFAGSLDWKGKGFDAGATAYYAPLRQGILGAKSEYQFGLGFDADVTKRFNVSIGGAVGRENIFVGDCNPLSATFEPTRYYAVSGLVTVNVSDTVRAEIGYARKYYSQSCHSYRTAEDEVAGIYYEPVKKLTLGIEAEWIPFNGGPADAFIPVPSQDETRIGFVSKFRF